MLSLFLTIAHKIGTYVHVVRLPHGPDVYGIACACPRWKATMACLHQYTLTMYLHELELLPVIAPSPIPNAVYLVTTQFRELYIYSCTSSSGRYDSSKRVIVSYLRNGRWLCESCGYADTCKHRSHAIEHATLAGFISDMSDSPRGDADSNDVEGELLVAVGGRNERKYGCISYQHVSPPRWCSFPHEETRTARPPSLLPSCYHIDALSRCCCGVLLSSLPGYGTVPGPAQPLSIHPATLYGLTYRTEVTIQILPCPMCRHRRRWIGPDLGSAGILNWNNAYLFTHELMNAYTNQYTASETPFSAFCTTVRRCYEDHIDGVNGKVLPFCSDETFVRAWFDFIQLQDLDSMMQCPTCGPSPPIVIADGISLATHASKLTSAIRPPTYVDAASEVVNSITQYKARGLAAITQKELRSVVLRFVEVTAARNVEATLLPDLSKMAETYPEVTNFLNLVLVTTSVGDLEQRRVYRELARQV